MGEPSQASDVSWPQEDPNLTLEVLRGLKATALPNGKCLPKSYKNWGKLNRDQKNKATAYFNLLSTPVKVAICNQVATLANEEASRVQRQSLNTTVHDRARFIHAIVDPMNQAALTEAMAPMDRELLDSRDDRKAPWEKFAENFNNYELCCYQNATVRYEDGVMKIPYEALPGFETIAVSTHIINPQDDSRPKRDAAWCEKMWKEVRGSASRINENYRKSGNQDAENQFTEWAKFCDNYSEVYKYFKVVVSDGFIDNLGRALPSEQQRDTGGLQDDDAERTPGGKRNRKDLSDSVGARNRRRQRQRRKEMSSTAGDEGDSPAVGLNGLSSVVQEELRRKGRLDALKIFADYNGTDPEWLERKHRAMMALEKEAFGID